MIPKIIHQIWIGNKEPPYQYLDTWKKYCLKYPGYQYQLWKETEIDQLWKKVPKFLYQIYQMEKEYCGKADIARLVILYLFGGIYLDADTVSLMKSFDDLINEDKCPNGFFVGKEPKMNFVGNSVMGSSKNHSNFRIIFKELERLYPKYQTLREDKGCWIITGPILITQSILKGARMTIYPEEYFYPIKWSNQINKIDEINKNKFKNSYLIHYGDST